MSDMEQGAFTRNGYTVDAGVDGSFVVYQGGRSKDGYFRHMHGFTGWQDLIAWLTQEHQANAAGEGLRKADSDHPILHKPTT
jgi:hypothetical protein